MKKRKSVTDEDISKAYEALGLELESFNKGEEEEPEEEEVNKSEEPEEEPEEEEEEEPEEEEEEPEVKKGGTNRFDRIEKAIATSHQINSKYIKALGVLVKDISQKTENIMSENKELKEIIKSQEDTIAIMSEKLEEFGSEVPAPKSIMSSRPVERTFGKAEDIDITKGGEGNRLKSNQLSISANPSAIVDILDQATFAKGFDDEFSKACTAFEASKTISPNIISRIKNEFGIEIVK